LGKDAPDESRMLFSRMILEILEILLMNFSSHGFVTTCGKKRKKKSQALLKMRSPISASDLLAVFDYFDANFKHPTRVKFSSSAQEAKHGFSLQAWSNSCRQRS
jgi:hypothetical protein